jgi:hypothetical protein
MRLVFRKYVGMAKVLGLLKSCRYARLVEVAMRDMSGGISCYDNTLVLG